MKTTEETIIIIQRKDGDYLEKDFNNGSDKRESDLWCDYVVWLTVALTGLEISERKREEPRLTVKYLAQGTGTTEFLLIGMRRVKEEQVWGAGNKYVSVV